MRQKGIQDPKPRDQFDTDLLAFIGDMTNQGYKIVLLGDFNESMKKSHLFEQLYNLGLKHMINDRHFDIPDFRTYNRGKEAIDHAMCSVSILPYVRTSTYTPFQLHTSSDHRGILIDFDRKLLLGKTQSINTIPHRGVVSTNEKQTTTFIQYLTKYWDEYNIDQRVDNASKLENKKILRKVLNSIDRDITQAFLQAEKRTKNKDRPPWSPILKAASLQVKRLQLLFEEYKTQTDHTQAIQHTESQMDTTRDLPKPHTKQECQYYLRKAQKNLRKIRKKARELRIQHLENLIEKYNLTNDKERKKIIRRIQRAEAISKCYRKLRWLLHPPNPGVTFIQHTTDDGITRTIYDRQTLEQVILQRNKHHFNQCAGSTFTTGILRNLNWASDSDLADSILAGTYPIETMTHDIHLQTILHLCKRLGAEYPATIDITKLRGLFKKWRETTTTSPSGRHLGLYKTIYNHEDPRYANTLTNLFNILLQNGISLTRWRQVLNMMIHKVEGQYDVNKLRVIHIFEADYNGLIGLLFNRHLLYKAEQANLLNNNQWGCRPHRTTDDALLLKELTYDLTLLTKTTLATFDNDATGCFDRVPCSIAMLASRRLGADIPMCRIQADNLQHITHRLRTAFGESADSYSSTDDIEIHGQGQGSRAAPPTWVFVSSLLLDSMERIGHGVKYTCPEQTIHHHRHNDAFVDDVTGYANDFVNELSGHDVINSVLNYMNHDANAWNKLLVHSGGKLALHKCLYYAVAWKWKRGNATTLPPSALPIKISITSEDDQLVPIRQLPCNEAHRTLGQMKAPIHSAPAQLKYMISKSKQWTNAIKQSTLNPLEAQVAYDTMWFPSLSYGVSTTNLSQKELDLVQKPIVNYILPRMGYNRHFPRAVVYGSPNFGGLNFKHLFIEQGLQHVLQFIRQYRSNNSIGQLLQISLRWFRLVAGVSYCPLQKPEYNTAYVEHPWFNTLMTFLRNSHASIETNDEPKVFCRTDDSCLIEDFLLLDPTISELRTLNKCRLFLRATTLSDIVNSNGTHILERCWLGTEPLDSPLLWPRQQQPPAEAWRLWRTYLASCYLDQDEYHHKQRKDLTLIHRLGQWNQNHRPRQIRTYYVSPTSNTVYLRHQLHYTLFYPYRNQRTHISLREQGRTTYLPNDAHPIDPQRHDNKILQISKQFISPIPVPNTPLRSSFHTHISLLEPWETELLQHFEFTSTTLQETASLTNTPFIIATDGSKDKGRGSFGWVLSTVDGQVFAKGMGTAFGSDMTSFRSEAYGILAAYRFVIQIQRYFYLPTRNTAIVWWCDCESLLTRLHTAQGGLQNANRFKLSDHDLEMAILASKPLLTNHLTSHHLHSHKFDNSSMEKLPLPQRLNRIADTLAKTHIRTLPAAMEKVPLITIARCQLHIRNATITRIPAIRLRQSFTNDQSQAHIRTRFGFTPHTYDQIAWPEFAAAFKSLSNSQQRIFRRWMYGFLPTQKRLHRYGNSPDDLCPVCHGHVETDLHFIHCGCAESWTKSLFEPLRHICNKLKATHWVETSIHQNLTQYLNTQDPIYPDPWIRMATLSQTEIGWKNCFYGFYSKQWIANQNAANPNHSGSRLLVKIIRVTMEAVVTRWHARNDQLHQSTQPDTPSETRKRLTTKLTALYSCEQDTLPGDRQIFKVPLETMILKPNKHIKLFIEQNQPIIKQSIKQQQQRILRQHKDISSYFNKQTPANHRNARVTIRR